MSPRLAKALLPSPAWGCVWRSPGLFLVKSLMFYSRAFREAKSTQWLMIHSLLIKHQFCAPKKIHQQSRELPLYCYGPKSTHFCLRGVPSLSPLSTIHLLGPCMPGLSKGHSDVGHCIAGASQHCQQLRRGLKRPSWVAAAQCHIPCIAPCCSAQRGSTAQKWGLPSPESRVYCATPQLDSH